MTTVLQLLFLACLGAAAVQATDNEAIICRRDWFKFFSRSEECLTYVDSYYTWHKATKVCKYWYSTLFYPIDNADYRAALRLVQRNSGSEGAWLGACKLSNGSYVTSDNQNYNDLWSGSYSLTASGNPAGFLEMDSDTPHFTYTSYSYAWYWWHWYKVYPKRHFICGEKPCRINCERLCALIAALEALLD